MLDANETAAKKYTEELEEMSRQVLEMQRGLDALDKRCESLQNELLDTVSSMRWTFGHHLAGLVLCYPCGEPSEHFGWFCDAGAKILLVSLVGFIMSRCELVNMYVCMMWRWISLANSVIWNLCILQRAHQNKPATERKRRRCERQNIKRHEWPRRNQSVTIWTSQTEATRRETIG